MGEIADAMLNGEFCAGCGEYMGDGDGFPEYCSSCKPANEKPKFNNFYPIKRGPDIDALREFLGRNDYNCVDEAQDKNGKPLFRILNDTRPDSDWHLPDRVATIVVIQLKLLDSVKTAIKQHKKG